MPNAVATPLVAEVVEGSVGRWYGVGHLRQRHRIRGIADVQNPGQMSGNRAVQFKRLAMSDRDALIQPAQVAVEKIDRAGALVAEELANELRIGGIRNVVDQKTERPPCAVAVSSAILYTLRYVEEAVR